MIKMKGDALKLNRKGAVLVWAVVVLLLLTILIGSVLTLSMAYYIRCVNNHSARQAGFTARSAVDSIASVICGGDTSENRDVLLSQLPSDGSPLNLNDIQFHAGSMDHCSAVIKRETYNGADTLLITATAVVGKQTKSVLLRLGQNFFPSSGGTIQYVNANETDQVTNKSDTDYYAKSGSTLEIFHSANYNGTIYVESNATLQIDNGVQYEGKIYLQSGAVINYSKIDKHFTGNFFAKTGSVITVNGVQVTVTVNADDTVSFSPPDTGFNILDLFSVNDWNRVSGHGGGTGPMSSLWSPIQYEPA